MVKGLSSIDGVHVAPPSGGFFAFFTIDGVTDSAAFALKVVREAGVALAPGSAFGPGGEGWFRVSLVAEIPVLEEAIERIGAAGVAYR